MGKTEPGFSGGVWGYWRKKNIYIGMVMKSSVNTAGGYLLMGALGSL